MRPITIIAASPLEIAALRAVFHSADGNWFGTFVPDTMHFLYELSDLMVKWSRSLK